MDPEVSIEKATGGNDRGHCSKARDEVAKTDLNNVEPVPLL